MKLIRSIKRTVIILLVAFVLLSIYLSLSLSPILFANYDIEENNNENVVLIAHRGASGYLPEHTLASKAMAYAMEPDFLEQDVALTKDDHAIIIHDCELDTTSNVAELFPDRKRSDGRYYALDFTLEEIKKLTIIERINLETGKRVFPGRFPLHTCINFKISTLEEEIELIQGLNRSTGKNIGIYLELKQPDLHKKDGKDIAIVVLNILKKYGYDKRESNCYIQCFESETLKYIKNTLKSELRLVQLLFADYAPELLRKYPEHKILPTPEGIKNIAEYADGIGPYIGQLVIDKGPGNEPEYTDFIKVARENNLLVHPYTFRSDALPSYVESIDELFDIFFNKIGVDGVFTDFPDKPVEFLFKNS